MLTILHRVLAEPLDVWCIHYLMGYVLPCECRMIDIILEKEMNHYARYS